mmetsp:Transcript_38242/g.104146  ORF Transcript_38242/g.104146 Transcript_38242/m.104146 type:complete len:246 (-) Transcript_38242:742-1479(-)
MASASDEILRHRLKSRETVFIQASIKRVASKFTALAASVLAKDDGAALSTDAQEAANNAIRELQLCSLEVDKAEMVAQTCDRQLSQYTDLAKGVQEQIAASEASIEALSQELKQAKTVRQHKEEYEALAKVVNRHSAKSQTRQVQEETQARLASLEEEAQALEEQVKARNQQFALLMQTIQDLQRTMGEENERPEGGEGAAEEEEGDEEGEEGEARGTTRSRGDVEEGEEDEEGEVSDGKRQKSE